MKKLALLVLLGVPGVSCALIPNPIYLLEQGPEVYCKEKHYQKDRSYEVCVQEEKKANLEGIEKAKKKELEQQAAKTGSSITTELSHAEARGTETRDKSEEKKKQEEYLKSPEYKQKLLEEKQKDLEAKQAELEKKQKELEMKAEAIEVKAKSFPEAELAKSALGSKASIIEGLVPVIKSKDSETQQKVSLILESFKASKDEYTRNVGFYLSYLLE